MADSVADQLHAAQQQIIVLEARLSLLQKENEHLKARLNASIAAASGDRFATTPGDAHVPTVKNHADGQALNMSYQGGLTSDPLSDANAVDLRRKSFLAHLMRTGPAAAAQTKRRSSVLQETVIFGASTGSVVPRGGSPLSNSASLKERGSATLIGTLSRPMQSMLEGSSDAIELSMYRLGGAPMDDDPAALLSDEEQTHSGMLDLEPVVSSARRKSLASNGSKHHGSRSPRSPLLAASGGGGLSSGSDSSGSPSSSSSSSSSVSAAGSRYSDAGGSPRQKERRNVRATRDVFAQSVDMSVAARSRPGRRLSQPESNAHSMPDSLDSSVVETFAPLPTLRPRGDEAAAAAAAADGGSAAGFAVSGDSQATSGSTILLSVPEGAADAGRAGDSAAAAAVVAAATAVSPDAAAAAIAAAAAPATHAAAPAPFVQPPAPAAPWPWQAVYSRESGRFYFVNAVTLATSWAVPAGTTTPAAATASDAAAAATAATAAAGANGGAAAASTTASNGPLAAVAATDCARERPRSMHGLVSLDLHSEGPPPPPRSASSLGVRPKRPRTLTMNSSSDVSGVEAIVVITEVDEGNPSEGPRVVGTQRVTGELLTGTLDFLVSKLVGDLPANSTYLKVFLLSFRDFVAPTDLLILLGHRYQDAEGDAGCSAIRLRVLNFCRKWIRTCPQDFQRDLLVYEGMSQLIAFGRAAFGQLCAGMDELLESTRFSGTTTVPVAFTAVAQVSSVWTMLESDDGAKFLSLDTEAVVRFLTLAETEVFRAVPAFEFVLLNSKHGHPTPNLNVYIDWFNNLAAWASTTVVVCDSAKQRGKVITRLINICEQLVTKLSVYNAAMALMAALSTTAVTRLTGSWKGLSAATRRSWRTVQETLSHTHNFARYRSELTKRGPPGIPFLGLHMQDILHLRENVPSVVDDRIHIGKFGDICKVVGVLESFQLSPHQFKQKATESRDFKAVTTFFRELYFLSEKELFEQSLKREAREA